MTNGTNKTKTNRTKMTNGTNRTKTNRTEMKTGQRQKGHKNERLFVPFFPVVLQLLSFLLPKVSKVPFVFVFLAS